MTTLVQRPGWTAVVFLVGTALFTAAYCQAPLYYSNQNQYFLHGLAQAGEGQLRDDWLASTHDPTPVFSGLVALTARLLHPLVFHLYYVLLMGAYAAAMLGVFAFLAGPDAQRRAPLFLVLFFLVHAALVRWCSYRWLGSDYPWFLQAGVAGQYVLGPVLQPSSFGVLLVVAVSLFAWDRPLSAGVCVALAATVHPSYLLPGALLTLGFLTSLSAEGRIRQALGAGVLTLALVLPVAVHSVLAFRPTTPEQFARAQDTLVNLRIPHHCRVDLWLDPIAGLQILWIGLALALVWRTRLFIALAVPFALAALLTVLQAATDSHTLALLFPWRISAVLVPIATTVVLTRLVRFVPLRGACALLAVVATVLVAGGVWISVKRLGFQSGADERGVTEFVRRTKKPGDVYFVPVTVPDLKRTTHGSLSSDFKPFKDKRLDDRVIPPDLQGFRMATGAPIFVDFKSIPYQDVEVLQWEERLRAAQQVQDDLRAGRVAQALDELRRRGVTHLVAPDAWRIEGAGVEEVYPGPNYRVYRITPSATGGTD
jgi:hypothetical protein